MRPVDADAASLGPWRAPAAQTGASGDGCVGPLRAGGVVHVAASCNAVSTDARPWGFLCSSRTSLVGGGGFLLGRPALRAEGKRRVNPSPAVGRAHRASRRSRSGATVGGRSRSCAGCRPRIPGRRTGSTSTPILYSRASDGSGVRFSSEPRLAQLHLVWPASFDSKAARDAPETARRIRRIGREGRRRLGLIPVVVPPAGSPGATEPA